MTYFLREKKWMAWVVLLTFLFTSFMPSSAWADSSTDVVADETAIIKTFTILVGQTYVGGEDDKLKVWENNDVNGKCSWYSEKEAIVEVCGVAGHPDWPQITGKSVGTTKIVYTCWEKKYVAEVTVVDKIEPKEVPVVNTEAAGIGITITEANRSQPEIPGGGYEQWTAEQGKVRQGLVANTLQNGYPVLANEGTSLKSYFANATTANGLFIQSIYDTTGYYEYSSFDNGCLLLEDGTLQAYEELMTPLDEDKYYYQRGNFLPHAEGYGLVSTNKNLYDGDGKALSENATRRGENLYLPQKASYHFGMTFSAKFAQLKDGQVMHNGEPGPMRFEFNGDDDMWVFIDDVLVLDIGGIHDAHSGYIDFATGEVAVYDCATGKSPTKIATSIKQQFVNAGRYDEAAFRGDTFADYTTHEIKVFYMERGEGASNLKIRFNLPTFSGNPELQKLVELNEAFINPDKSYAFHVQTAEKADGTDGIDYTGKVAVIRNNGSTEEINPLEEGKLTLKHGEIATFDVPDGKYVQITEEKETTDAFDTENQVVAQTNSNETTVKTVVKERAKAGDDKTSGWQHILPNEKCKLFYTFYNSIENSDLSITKKLAAKNNGEKFQFRVYFKNTVKKNENGMVKPMPKWTLYNGSYTVDGDNYQAKDGKIQLSANKTAIIKDIPVDTEYFVTEILESDSYTVEELQTVVAPKDSAEADNGNTIVESGSLKAGTMGLAGKIENSENANAVTITNIPITEKIAIRGQKIWQGDSELDRPETITIHIMKGNDVVATTTSSLTMDWKYEVSGLRKYDTDGKPIPYTVKEEPVSGYVAKIKQPVMTDEANEYVVTITNAKSSVLDGMINLAKKVEGDISNASTNKFAFRLTMTIDNEEANAEEEVNTAVAQTLDTEYENTLDALDEELNAAWKEVVAAVDGFKEVCAEIMPEAKAQLPEEEEKPEEAAAKPETGVETAETQVAETEDAALENSVEETVDAGADADLADEAENDSETEELATAESTSEDGEAAVVEEACTVEESDFSEAPEEAADDVVSYSTESYSMVARTLNSIEFKVLNGEGNVTANEIVGRLAALLSQKEISDEDATNQLSLVLMLALDQEDLDDVEREEALAVVADAMVEMPAEQAAYTPEQLQRLYQAAGEVLEKYEIYQERKTEKAAFDAAQIETVRLYDGLEVADPVAATPSAIQLVLDYGKDEKVTVELKRQENGTYVYDGIELMDGQSVGIDVKATTGSAINFTITETETGGAKTVDFQQGTTTWMETTSVSGRIAPGQSVSYTAINTFDAEEESEDPTPVEPAPTEPTIPTEPVTPVEPTPTEPTIPTEPVIPVEPTPTEPAPTEPIPTPTTPEPSVPETTIDDPTVPLAEPEVTDEVEPAEPTEPTGSTEPDVEIFDLAVPLSDMPGTTVEEAIQIDEPQVPLSDAPQTGDNSKALPFMLLMMVAGCGLVITRKRFN